MEVIKASVPEKVNVNAVFIFKSLLLMEAKEII